jgi:dienelactone hydrolase
VSYAVVLPNTTPTTPYHPIAAMTFFNKPTQQPSNLRSKLSGRRLSVALLVGVVGLAATGCANNQQQTWERTGASRSQALADAVGMPGADTHQITNVVWTDASRKRDVLAKLYLPAQPAGQAAQRVPLVVFSHGIGGSREGYSYIGKYLAANGMAALHLQHAGSDRNIWFGNPLGMVSRLQTAAKETEAIDRAKDVSFALDQVLADAALSQRIDASRIAAAGHSYGANTTLLVAGARVQRDGRTLDYTDARIKAAVIISAPPFYGEGDPQSILGSVAIPTLHITATGDEIKIPGYYSGAQDRVTVYEAIGSATVNAAKALAVFKEGSHSMFTDRLGTGGAELNPKIKIATRELTLAFLKARFAGQGADLGDWPERHKALLARFERKG